MKKYFFLSFLSHILLIGMFFSIQFKNKMKNENFTIVNILASEPSLGKSVSEKNRSVSRNKVKKNDPLKETSNVKSLSNKIIEPLNYSSNNFFASTTKYEKNISGDSSVRENENAKGKVNLKIISQNIREQKLFNELATLINIEIEYPDFLIDEEINGDSKIKIYFLSDGKIDENKSFIIGSNDYFKGVLIRAARKALKKWYTGSDIEEIKKAEKFELTANFSIERDAEVGLNGLRQLNEKEFQIIKKVKANNFKNLIADQITMPLSINLATPLKMLYDKIDKSRESTKIRREAKKDVLKDYSEIGFKNINQEVIS